MANGSAEWGKVLWRTSARPDNYIPPELFLSSLRKNPNFEPYDYWPLVFLACAITQHLATIFVFLSVFVRLKENLLDPYTLVLVSIVCFLGGYAAWGLLDWSTHGQPDQTTTHLTALKSSILMFLGLMSLSPVLRTLTAATSSDSIWALSAILFILNALLADHSSLRHGGQVQERLSSVLSMNAAVSSSVVLASRLSTDVAVFALILFSVQVFALFPMLRHRLQDSPRVLQASLTFILSIIAVFMTAPLSWVVTYIYSAILFSITFLAPAVLVWAQKYKNEIRGPWDVAVPKVN